MRWTRREEVLKSGWQKCLQRMRGMLDLSAALRTSAPAGDFASRARTG